MNISKNISKLAFLFIVFAVVAGGSVTHVLSCQFQSILETSFVIKHVFGVLLIFLFIMLEGGWDFSKKELDKAPVDWASGNTIHTMIYAIGIYVFFLVSSKSKLKPNLLFYGLLFMVFFVDSYRNYLLNRNRISNKNNKLIVLMENIVLGIAFIIFIYGFIDYYNYKKSNLKNKFNWWKFIMYTKQCGYDGKKELNL